MVTRIFRLLCVLFGLVNTACAAEVTAPQRTPPKVLIFSAVDTRYAADTLEFWGKDVGINGFILSYLAHWQSSKSELAAHRAVLKRLNSQGQQYGIDSNFIKVALGDNKLPAWTDDKAWKSIIESFKNIAELAKETGSKGIALDTEPYTIALFDSRKLLNEFTTHEQLREKVYLRGQQIMQALTSTYPDIEVIIMPEGALYSFNLDLSSDTQVYELWIDFYNGMASVKNNRGIILASERSYDVTDRNFLTNIHNLIDTTMKSHTNDPSFWHRHCSIALGMWPLGKEYDNKAARYSPAQFKTQFTQAVQLSGKYVWIYDHGSAWFQLKPGDVAKYNVGNRLWAKEYQVLPTTHNIDAYYAVLRDYKNSLNQTSPSP